MSASYRVVAPYVTLLVKDGNGSNITLGYYQGAVIEDPVEGDHLDQLVDSNYIESVSGPKDAFGPGVDPDDLPDAETAPKKSAVSKSK